MRTEVGAGPISAGEADRIEGETGPVNRATSNRHAANTSHPAVMVSRIFRLSLHMASPPSKSGNLPAGGEVVL